MNETRYPDNAPGMWYVNDECICCHLCEEHAPDTFRLSADGDHHIVFHQPEDDELQSAEDAREACPVEAICDNG